MVGEVEYIHDDRLLELGVLDEVVMVVSPLHEGKPLALIDYDEVEDDLEQHYDELEGQGDHE